jgi:hypothetical protein
MDSMTFNQTAYLLGAAFLIWVVAIGYIVWRQEREGAKKTEGPISPWLTKAGDYLASPLLRTVMTILCIASGVVAILFVIWKALSGAGGQ